jgi:transposase InsO family protein
LGTKKLKEIVKSSNYYVIRLLDIAQEIVNKCQACALTNAGHYKNTPGRRLRGERPRAYWETDFTEVKPAKYGNKYLLVFIDTFSGWVKVFPTKKETSNVVAKKILEENFPRFGIPKVLSSDNCPSFVAQVSQGLARQLGIDRKLHCAYKPQSSGQVEQINRTLKETLTRVRQKRLDSSPSLCLVPEYGTPQGNLNLHPLNSSMGDHPPLTEARGMFDPDVPFPNPCKLA